MKHSKRQFTLNIASGWVAQLSAAGVGFVLMPFIINGLGEKAYGTYQLARSTIVFFMLLQLGMGPTLIRYFSKAIANKDHEEIRRISSTAQFLLGGMGLIAALLCLALIPFFLRFYSIPIEQKAGTIGLLVCLALSLFLNMVAIIPQGLLLGLNRYELSNGIAIFGQLLRLGVVVLLFKWQEPSIFFVGIALLLSSFWLVTVSVLIVAKHLGSAAFFSIKYIRKDTLRSLLGFSSLNLINSIAASLVFQGPVLIIGKILGQEMVAAFAPALIVSSAMQGVLGQTARPLVPIASRDIADHGGKNLRKWAILMGQLCAFVGFGAVLPLAIFGPEIIQLWLGDGLRWIWPIVVIISAGVALSQIQAANYFLAMGGGNIKPTVISQAVMAIIVFLGTWIGLQWMDWNLFYVAGFMGLCILLRNTFYLAYAYSKQFLYNFWRYEGLVYAVPALITTFCIGLGWGIKSLTNSENLLFFVGIGVIVASIYTMLWWFILIPKNTKSKIISFARLKLGCCSIS